MPNWNDAPEQREYGETIPDGTFVRLRIKITPGGHTHPGEDPRDAGLFKASNRPGSDAVSLDAAFTVIGGPYANRQVFQSITIDGGSRNDQGQSIAGNMSRTLLRAICESINNVRPDDQSPQAQMMRAPPAYAMLQNCEFAARLGVQGGDTKEDGSRYPDKNIIGRAVTPDDPRYPAIMAGQEVPPEPTGVRPGRDRPGAGTGNQGQLFGGGAAAPPAGGGHWTQAPPAAPPAPPAQPAVAPPPPAAAPAAGWGNGAAASAGAPAAGQPAPGAAGDATVMPGWMGR